jgi:hypothetical protein
MSSKTQSFNGGPRSGLRQACPKCGSAEVRRLALIHEAGPSVATSARASDRANTVLARHAAPPSKKNLATWRILAGTAVFVAIVSLRHPVGTLLAFIVAALSVGIALRAGRYNSVVYPGLHDLWARSFMCGRCGEVFSK